MPERRLGLDRADGGDGLAQEGVRGGLDRTGRVGFDQRLHERRGTDAGAGVDGERVEADLGPSEVEVVDGPSGGHEAEAELGERALGVDQDHSAVEVVDVVGEVPGHDRALAAALAADQRVPVLAIGGGDRDRTALVTQQHALRVAGDLGGAIARRTAARGSRACLTRARGSCHSVASSDVESTPRRSPGSGLGIASSIRRA